MQLNDTQSVIHGSQDFNGLGCGGRLGLCQLTKVAVYKAHENKSAKSDNFPGVFTGQCKVVSEWFAHEHDITLIILQNKLDIKAGTAFLVESGSWYNYRLVTKQLRYRQAQQRERGLQREQQPGPQGLQEPAPD